MVQMNAGTIEAKILQYLMEVYPVTKEDVMEKFRLSEERLELAIGNLLKKGFIELEPLEDRTYIRLLAGNIQFIGLNPTQKKRLKHKGKKKPEKKDYDGYMYG